MHIHIINIIQITRNWQTDVNRKSLPLAVKPTKTQQWLFILSIGLWLSFYVYRFSFHLLCFWIPSLKALLLFLGYDSQYDRQHLSALKICFNFFLFFLGSLLLHSVDLCSGTHPIWDGTSVIKDWICLRKWLILLC